MSGSFTSRAALWASIVLLSGGGCVAGGGEGWILGSLNVEHCRDGEPFVDEEFDLGPDFFVGDPLVDSSESVAVKRSSVAVRIQHTSNHIEQSDGLMLHIHDVAAAAAGFANSEPIGVGECFNLAGCPSRGLVLRAQLQLYNRCPGNKSNLTASNREIALAAASTTESQCFRPVPETSVPICPALDDESRQRLDALCEDGFSDQSNASDVKQLLAPDNVFDESHAAGSACIYFCELGGAQRGQTAEDLARFELDYGDTIAAIFAFNVVDPRAFQLDDCANTRGQIYGMFSFELARSRAAQAFP